MGIEKASPLDEINKLKTFVLTLGLPYLEKQKSGQWMATFHETKFMGFSIFLLTKSGRSNSALDLIYEGEVQLLKDKKKGGISKKKKVITCLAARFGHFQAENCTTRAADQVLAFFFFFSLEISLPMS